MSLLLPPLLLLLPPLLLFGLLCHKFDLLGQIKWIPFLLLLTEWCRKEGWTGIFWKEGEEKREGEREGGKRERRKSKTFLVTQSVYTWCVLARTCGQITRQRRWMMQWPVRFPLHPTRVEATSLSLSLSLSLSVCLSLCLSLCGCFYSLNFASLSPSRTFDDI